MGCLYKMVMHTLPGWCELKAVREHHYFLEKIPTRIQGMLVTSIEWHCVALHDPKQMEVHE